jgi:hypothetical protein
MIVIRATGVEISVWEDWVKVVFLGADGEDPMVLVIPSKAAEVLARGLLRAVESSRESKGEKGETPPLSNN